MYETRVTYAILEFLDKSPTVPHNGHSLNERRITMGRSTTPTYRIEARTNDISVINDCVWNSKYHGRANQENLEKWRTILNASFQPGGVNEHIAEARKAVPHIIAAKLIRQSTGEVVAETKMPAFEVV